MVITISVDDMVVMANHISHIQCFKTQLLEFFKITDLGELNWLLGLKVTRDRVARTLTLSQRAYVDTIINHFSLGEAKSAQTPMEPGTMLSVDQSQAMFSGQNAMRNIPYQHAIGSLMYAAMSTRPDIAFTVATLSQFMQNPGKAHWEATEWALRYLKGTANLELTLGTMDKGLQAFVDADWASQPHRHSMSGYIILLNGRLVTWSA
jgi:hypothetical protein